MIQHTLLAIFAHPDDEAFGTGGTLARYAAEGVRVRLICATRGESGKLTDPDQDASRGIAALREDELKEACRALGLEPPVFLDYHDSGRQERTQYHNPKALMNVDDGEIELELRKHIAELEPTLLLTFDPHGVYGHIDHVKIHRATNAAFWSADGVTNAPPKRLFYTALASEWMRAMQETRGRSPLAELDPGVYGVDKDTFAAVLDVSRFKDQKEAAVRAHRSQTGPQSSFADMPDEMWQEMFLKETFTLGGLRGSFPDMPVDDLFAGL